MPHLLKNIRGALCARNSILLAPSIVELYGLSSNVVTKDHVKALIDFQESQELKIAPDLNALSINPGHFSKMCVRDALKVISLPVSSGLRYLVNKHGYSRDLLTTAWFIEITRKWFDLLTSRHFIEALSMKNMFAYVEAMNHLKTAISVYESLTIENGHWKPWQTGVLMSTKSIIHLQEKLLVTENFDYVLTARFTSDCIENLFSQVRSKNPVPSAKEVKANLRAVSIAQFLTEKKGANYNFDDGEFLADFLKIPDHQVTKEEDQEDHEIERNPNLRFDLTVQEEDVLYYVCGWVLKGVRDNSKVCDDCVKSVLSSFIENVPNSLLEEKDFTGESLVRVSSEIFDFFLQAEKRFQRVDLTSKSILKSLVANHLASSQAKNALSCHDILQKMLTKFFRFRLKTHGTLEMKKDKIAKKSTKIGVEKSSKSMAMRKYASNTK